MHVNIVFVSLCIGIAGFKTEGAPLKPKMFKRGYVNEINKGYTCLECEFSESHTVAKIVYEKTDPQQPYKWTPVFEGFNVSSYKALESVDGYSLRYRNDYAVFPTHHILYISPLKYSDKGQWRCVVYYENIGLRRSNILDLSVYTEETLPEADLKMHTSSAPVIAPIISRGSFSNHSIGGHTSLECEFSLFDSVVNIIYEKTGAYSAQEWIKVYEGFNMNFQNSPVADQDRYDYAIFPSHHILYIKSLQEGDKGPWRCVVYYKNWGKVVSKVLVLNLAQNYRTESLKPADEPAGGTVDYTEYEIRNSKTAKHKVLLFIIVILFMYSIWHMIYMDTE